MTRYDASRSVSETGSEKELALRVQAEGAGQLPPGPDVGPHFGQRRGRFGINIKIAQQTAAGAILGPRVIASGKCFQFPGTWPAGLARSTETPEELLNGIRELIEKGAGLIKVAATGFRSTGEQFASMSPAAMKVAVSVPRGRVEDRRRLPPLRRHAPSGGGGHSDPGALRNVWALFQERRRIR